MPVNALGAYAFPSRDHVKNFHGNILVNFCWDRHVFFAAPFAIALPPTMTLRDAVTTVVANAIKVHPDAGKIDWDAVRWQKDDKPWQPDLDKSLAANGVGHKDYIVFNTPGLTGLKDAGL